VRDAMSRFAAAAGVMLRVTGAALFALDTQ
jgi:hypothetical protein